MFSKVYLLILSSPNSGRTLDMYLEKSGFGEITITLLDLRFKLVPWYMRKATLCSATDDFPLPAAP